MCLLMRRDDAQGFFFSFLLPQVMCDLISKMRDQTQAPCIGSV